MNIHKEIQEAMFQDASRYYRAKQFSDQIIHLLQDYLPRDRACLSTIQEHLIVSAYQANATIITVKPEWDHLDKIRLETALHDLKMKSVMETNQ